MCLDTHPHAGRIHAHGYATRGGGYPCPWTHTHTPTQHTHTPTQHTHTPTHAQGCCKRGSAGRAPAGPTRVCAALEGGGCKQQLGPNWRCAWARKWGHALGPSPPLQYVLGDGPGAGGTDQSQCVLVWTNHQLKAVRAAVGLDQPPAKSRTSSCWFGPTTS
eukprot:353791-Chlamydomonas_euryale.AAC.5